MSEKISLDSSVIFYYICAVKEYATPQVAYSLYPTFGT